MTTPDYDVVVVGAHAAGASTAMLLAKQDQRVLVVDRARSIIQTDDLLRRQHMNAAKIHVLNPRTEIHTGGHR